MPPTMAPPWPADGVTVPCPSCARPVRHVLSEAGGTVTLDVGPCEDGTIAPVYPGDGEAPLAQVLTAVEAADRLLLADHARPWVWANHAASCATAGGSSS